MRHEGCPWHYAPSIHVRSVRIHVRSPHQAGYSSLPLSFSPPLPELARNASFPGPGTVPQLGTSPSSSSCSFTRRPPRKAFFQRCKCGQTCFQLLARREGPAGLGCWAGTWTSPMIAPPLPLCLRSGRPAAPLTACSSLFFAGSTLTFAAAGSSATNVHLLCPPRPEPFSFRFQPEQ